MALSKRSVAQAEQVYQYFKEKGIDTIRTRSKFYRVIELIKFPGLNPYRYRTFESLDFEDIGHTNVYGSEQYKPIENYLIEKGYISRLAMHVSGSKYIYWYFINDPAIQKSKNLTYFEQVSKDPIHYFHNIIN